MRHIVTLTNRSRILYKKETCFFPEGSHKFPNTYDQDINIATMSKYTPIKTFQFTWSALLQQPFLSTCIAHYLAYYSCVHYK